MLNLYRFDLYFAYNSLLASLLRNCRQIFNENFHYHNKNRIEKNRKSASGIERGMRVSFQIQGHVAAIKRGEGGGGGGRGRGGRGKVRSGYEIPARNRALANRSPRPVHRAVTEN